MYTVNDFTMNVDMGLQAFTSLLLVHGSELQGANVKVDREIMAWLIEGVWR